MRKASTIISSLLLISGSASAVTVPKTDCVKADNAEIEKLFERWNDSLKTGEARKVADNYLSDAILLPTVSNKIRLTDTERIDYFKHFIKNKPVGKVGNRIIRVGCNEAIDTGTYTFTFADKTEMPARYTFTYVWNGRDWKISSHHSSAMPEG